MRSQIPLGRVFGIRVGLHYSWFLIAALIGFSLFGQFRTTHPEWTAGLCLALAVSTAILFFISLLLHELAHARMAVSRGLPVREITLFALGGVSQIEKDSPDAKTEFWVTVVGPATSALIGLICLGLARFLGGQETPLKAVFSWLGYINLVLAAFNLIPGYPLDGGRILRAIVWWKTGGIERATRIAAGVGQAVAGCFIGLGILEFFSGRGVGGLWLAFIGWFLLQASRESYFQVSLRHSLEGVHVGDLMSRDFAAVDGGQSVQDFVDHDLLRTGRRYAFVSGNGGASGIVTVHEIKQVDRSQWPLVALRQIMLPLDRAHTVTPSDSLSRALELMAGDDVNQLPVVSNGHLDGVLSRAEIVRYLQTRAEIRA